VEVGVLDRRGAAATIDGHRYLLREVTPTDRIPTPIRRRHKYHQLLALRVDRRRGILGVLAVRPRVAEAVASLRDACERSGIRLELLAGAGRGQAAELAARAGVRLAHEMDALRRIRAAQAQGDRVAFASDSSHHGLAFASCDLAVGVTRPRAHYAARADLLVPDLAALGALMETLAKQDLAARDAIGLAALSNVVGAVWSLRQGGAGQASRPIQLAVAMTLSWNRHRLRGGHPRWATQMEIVDPRPERWGRHEPAAVLAHFRTTEQGLSSDDARARRVMHRPPEAQHAFLRALLAEARSPLIALLAAGGVAALALGSPGDVVVILITLGVNVVLGAWQNHSTSQLAATLEHVRDPIARARRGGTSIMLTAGELVPGDILVLTAGDRVAADARLVKADGLELDESALTGESFPVPKSVAKDGNGAAIVLAGTDVTVGSGLAVVVGVGAQTRMGALAAALAHEDGASALGERLAQLVRVVVPIVVAGGALVVVAGLAWGQPLVPQIALGLSIGLAAFPEGLPLMAAVGQSAAARRLIRRSAFVRRTGAIEALGRVDVACVDKTGTLTQGRLALQVVSDLESDVVLPATMLEPGVKHVLLTAALASPHPDADHHGAHPTDAAVIRAARQAGLGEPLGAERDEEARFNSARGFHGSRVGGRVVVKGAFELLLARCTTLGRGGLTVPLDAAEHGRVLGRAQELAARGLRVLLVAESTVDTAVEDPRALRVIGLIGLSDPLRDSVPEAVRRCQEAGIRVVMLTGDHPLTARTIAVEAGLLRNRGELFNAADLVELNDRDLDRRLEGVTVIARAAPLDKLRIVGALQRAGHTVAMTGDGINDAPALRLADAGVAMGRAGTEVARHAADLVLGDDDFTTLVEALVEGRGFWHNIRGALGLLLGGNLGELAVVVAAAALGRAVPLTVRQILATNLITDALPALAIVTQPPEHRHLAMLAREGSAALDRPLRADIAIRAIATALPTTGAYLLTLRRGLPEARSVAFASIVATQLAQTVLAGRAEGALTRPVALAVAASGGGAGLLFAMPALRRFFDLAAPSPGGWLAVGLSSAAAPLLSQGLRPVFGNGWRLPANAPVPHALAATL
jgi:calcium-translocating P-type ATPase